MSEPDQPLDYMDRWQVDCASRLMSEHGHGFGTAALLARYSRDMLETSIIKPQPLCLIAGI